MIPDLEPALLCRFEQLALEYDSDDIGELDQLAGDQATRGLASTDQYSKLFDQFLDEHATKDHQFEGVSRTVSTRMHRSPARHRSKLRLRWQEKPLLWYDATCLQEEDWHLRACIQLFHWGSQNCARVQCFSPIYA